MNVFDIKLIHTQVALAHIKTKRERDTCAGLFLLPPQCGSPPPHPACLALWPPGLLENQTVAPAQCTAFCEHTDTSFN